VIRVKHIIYPVRNFTLQVGATYVDSKVLGYYVSSSPVAWRDHTIDICGEGFPSTPTEYD